MRQPVVICNVCGSPVTTFSIIEATAGPIRSWVHTPIGLCPTCCDRLVVWIRGGNPDLTQQDGPGEALADTAAFPLPRGERAFRVDSWG